MQNSHLCIPMLGGSVGKEAIDPSNGVGAVDFDEVYQKFIDIRKSERLFRIGHQPVSH